jgi:uncharacterized membrane protein
MLSGNKKMKMTERSSPDRVFAFSDGVFAIIITIMVVELKKPESPTLQAFLHLWPTWISYIASYLFIAIVWLNHHYLMKHATQATARLMWANFAHLFSVSLIPFLTTWMADSKLAPTPVAMYAFVFFLVNVTYLALVWETLCDNKNPAVPPRVRWLLHVRSFITLSLFLAATILAFWLPFLGFGLVCCCLVLYLRPEIPEMIGNRRARMK